MTVQWNEIEVKQNIILLKQNHFISRNEIYKPQSLAPKTKKSEKTSKAWITMNKIYGKVKHNRQVE